MKKISILHIIKNLNLGGAETNLLNLVQASDRERFEIHVAYSYGGEFEPKFKEANIELFKYANKDHKVKSLATISIVARLVRYVLIQKIQIIHTHNFSSHIWGSVVAKLTGCKIVEHVHDYRYFEPMDFVRRKGFNNQYRYVNKFKNISDRVIVLTKQNRDYIIRKKLYPSERIYEYQNGIPLDEPVTEIFGDNKNIYKQQLNTKFGLRFDAMVILTPIRIALEKNADLILRIAPEVIHKMPNAVFLIAGNGPLYQETSNDIKKMGLEENIRLISFHADIHFLLRGSDIFLLPSFLELHSIAILEAMSMGVPIVISEDVGCNSEFIENWQNGVLLDPFKDDGWAQALIKLLQDAQLRQKIAENAYQTCLEKFNIKNVAKKFENLYVELTCP